MRFLDVLSLMIGIAVFLILSFYFTLTFMEKLKIGEKRSTMQAKRAAIIFFSLAIVLLSFFGIGFFVIVNGLDADSHFI